jgi:hypothetical protein
MRLAGLQPRNLPADAVDQSLNHTIL